MMNGNYHFLLHLSTVIHALSSAAQPFKANMKQQDHITTQPWRSMTDQFQVLLAPS
jgi:hypothetical protein